MARSILIADSDTHSRDMLTRLLGIFGYTEILTASDGLDALYQVVQKSPGIVVLDAQLPKLDGFLLSEILHNVVRFRETSSVLMHTTMDAATMEKGLLAGAYAFLEKPLTADGVKRVLGGFAAPAEIYPVTMSPQARVIVEEMAQAAKTMLNLIFGQPGKIVQVEVAKPEAFAKQSEISAVKKADGAAIIELAYGCSNEGAKTIATALGKKDFSQAALGQAAGDFLNSVMDRSIKRIREQYLVKSSAAQVRFGTLLPINRAAKEAYTIQLRAVVQSALLRKQMAMTLVVTISPR